MVKEQKKYEECSFTPNVWKKGVNRSESVDRNKEPDYFYKRGQEWLQKKNKKKVC